MNRKHIWLFLLVCGMNGFLTVLGSMLGNAFGKTGLFAGAIVGGIIGIALAGLTAHGLRLISQTSHTSTVFGGILGFIIAAVITVNNLHTPVIPMLSVSLVGLGAVVGNIIKKGKEN
jgi:hypothetical protein